MIFTAPMSFSICGRSPSCVACETMLAPRRCMKARPLLPMQQTSISSLCVCHSLYCASTRRSRLVFSAPHSPLSVVTTMMPTRFTVSRDTREGCRYSGLACEMCAATLRIFSPYGRAWRMRSCAFLIFEAATISIALVIFRVFCTLRIFILISLVPAIGQFLNPPPLRGSPPWQGGKESKRAALLPVFDRRLERFLFVGREVLLVFHALDQRRVLVLQVVAHRFLGGQRLLHVDVVEVAVVDGKQGERHLPDRERLVLRLLHQLGDHTASFQLLPRGFIEVGGELRKGRELAVLRERKARAAAR